MTDLQANGSDTRTVYPVNPTQS
jgi:hypothetical protein